MRRCKGKMQFYKRFIQIFLIMMVIVTVLDLVFGKLVGFVFGGTPLWPLW